MRKWWWHVRWFPAITVVETRDIRVLVWPVSFGWPRYTRHFYGGPNDLFTMGPLWIDRYA